MKLRIIIACLLFILFSNPVDARASFWHTDNARFDSLALLIEDVYYERNRKQINDIIEAMYALAEKTGRKNLLSYAKYWDARNCFPQNMQRAEALIDECLLSTDSLTDKYGYARFMLLKANIVTEQNDFVGAYRIYEEYIPYFDAIKDSISLGNIYIYEGNLMWKLANSEQALALYQKANAYHEASGAQVIQAKNKLNLYNIKFERGEGDAVYQELEQLIEDPLIKQDTLFLVNVMLTLHSGATNDSIRFKYAKKGYDLAKQTNNMKLLSRALINKTDMHFKRNELDSAVYYIRTVYDYSKESLSFKELLLACFALSYYHEKTQKPDSALHYIKEYVNCHDSIYSLEKISAINRIQAQASFDNYQKQIEATAALAEYERRKTLLTALLILSLFVLLCVILWYRWRKVKTEKRIKELENRELNKQLETEKLQNENFQLEIDYKNRELSTHTLMLNEKNITLKEIKKEIENMNLNGSISQKDKKHLEKRINEHLQADDEWKYVKQHFESVHPGFFTKLKAVAPMLSENELRLCVYFHMGMSTKEIARLLSILPASISMNRYRIRKKLDIDEEVILEDFLRTI